MTDEERTIFYAGVAQARAKAYVQHTSRGQRRPYLEVMFRDLEAAEGMQEHFGVGKIRTETPRYRQDIRNHVLRVNGQKALDVIERLLPYLTGDTEKACRSALERCGR
jgi:hypothetical protein